jgi:hypothetical protein
LVNDITELQQQLNQLSEPAVSLKPLIEDEPTGEPEASAP